MAYNQNNFTWKKDKLFLGKKLVLRLLADKKYPEMYWIESADHTWCSQDFYNRTRAKEHGYHLANLWLPLDRTEDGLRGTADAFNLSTGT